MTARIVVLGVTGFTGRQVARALVERGARPVLAGRDGARLARLAAELGGADPLETQRADVTHAPSVRRLVGAGDVLVSTVGPFVALGEAAVTAATEAGATYLDSTGEGPFIRRVVEHHGPRAEATGAALLTAFGSDWVPGNLAGGVALHATATTDTSRPVTRLEIGYFLTGTGRAFASRGTLASMAGIALAPAYRRRQGALVTERAGARLRRFTVDGVARPAITVGATEQLVLPRLSDALVDVDVYLGWLGAASGAVHRLSPVTSALAHVPGVPRALARAGTAVARRLPEGPDPAAGARVRTHVLAEGFDASGELVVRVRVDGPEPYAMTAELLAWGAMRAAGGAVHGAGALGPVDALGLSSLLEGAADAGLEVWIQRTGPRPAEPPVAG